MLLHAINFSSFLDDNPNFSGGLQSFGACQTSKIRGNCIPKCDWHQDFGEEPRPCEPACVKEKKGIIF